MSLSNSRLAYTDCYELLDRALDEPRGLRIAVPDTEAATYLRMRIHHARTIDRADNKKTYPDPNEPMHGRSAYDALIVRIEDGQPAFLWLDKLKVEILGVESIPEDARIEFTPPRQISAPMRQIEYKPETQPQIRRR